MQRKNIIVLLNKDNVPIARGNFKKLCDEFLLPYHSLKMLKFPIKYKEFIIHKIEFK
jgi:cyclophilin family peptidyl-prolyl cis-trans isomerase